MTSASARRDPDQQPQRRAVAALLRIGALAVVLLAVTVLAVQAGGLLEKLFTGKGTQRTEAPGPAGSTALATVHLTVEGMVCYG